MISKWVPGPHTESQLKPSTIERKCVIRVSVKVIGYILQQHLELYLYLKVIIYVAES
jgi:hypothetical protein